MPEHTQSIPDQRRERVRHAIIFLLLAIVLLLLALLLYSTAAPEWNADGSREPYPAWVRALLCASVIAGTMLMPISVRAFLLAALPSKTLGIVLGIFVGIFGVIAVPLELWLALGITDAEDPGARERYESSEDWDWD
jgi:cell division protein FtsW (lipid II flippase)